MNDVSHGLACGQDVQEERPFRGFCPGALFEMIEAEEGRTFPNRETIRLIDREIELRQALNA